MLITIPTSNVSDAFVWHNHGCVTREQEFCHSCVKDMFYGSCVVSKQIVKSIRVFKHWQNDFKCLKILILNFSLSNEVQIAPKFKHKPYKTCRSCVWSQMLKMCKCDTIAVVSPGGVLQLFLSRSLVDLLLSLSVQPSSKWTWFWWRIIQS